MEKERPENNKKRRGMKPRSQRNRKRPHRSSEGQELDSSVSIETTIVPLSLRQGSDSDKPVPNDDLPPPRLIRVVKPYLYTYCSFAKARWWGRSVLDLYCSEFGRFPRSYYEAAIRQGRILVSDRKVDFDYKIQQHDVLSHIVHRHEPAVAVSMSTAPFFKVVGETDDLVAFDKPGTLPVHPCGGYNQNSMMAMLEKETTYGKLYTIHRLDRLTSGLIVLAKTSASAKEWAQAIQQRNPSCEKIYLARVKGRFGQNFPSPLPVLGQNHDDNASLPSYGEWESDDSSKARKPTASCNDDNENQCAQARRRNAHGYWMTDAGPSGAIRKDLSLDEFSTLEHTVDEWLDTLSETATNNSSNETKTSPLVWLNLACPVRVEQAKIGVCSSGTFADLDASLYTKTVKPAHTSFGIVKYNPHDDSTLLLVRPATGRTHQIRIHLSYLGHCIANDPNYGGEQWFGNTAGQRACERAQATLDAGNTDDDIHQNLVTADVPATEAEVQRLVDDSNEKTPRADDHEGESLEESIERTCVWCARNQGKSAEERSLLEFQVRSPGLWLHALQYKVNGISFRADLPDWSRF